MPHDPRKLDRRDFLKATATLTGAAAVGSAPTAAAEPTPGAGAINEKDLIVRNRVPTMAYQRLGRTNYLCSRIVQGFGGDENLWRRLLARGVNYWDTGWGYGEGNHEKSLKPFLADHRDKLWITSKATNIAGFTRIDDEVRRLYLKAIKDFLPAEAYDRLENGDDKQGRADLLRFHEAAIAHQKATGKKPDLRPAGKRMAELYLQRLDESLQRMGIDHVDAYFVHGIEIPWIFDCIEVWEAYEKAHKAGKVRHFGFSTHQHQKPVLAAAAEANARGPWKIDLIMPGVNPITFDDWREELDALHKQDVGIIAMKTTGMKGKPLEGARRDRLRQKAGEIADYNECHPRLHCRHEGQPGNAARPGPAGGAALRGSPARAESLCEGRHGRGLPLVRELRRALPGAYRPGRHDPLPRLPASVQRAGTGGRALRPGRI
jgi:aryl-alcohol dehydrogenase-like predicted oxidoreductase